MSALFAVTYWPFKSAEARAVATEELGERTRESWVGMLERWAQRLREMDLAASADGVVTPDLVVKRGALKQGIVLHARENEISVRAVQLAVLEFREIWGEFCLITPGNLDWMGVGFQDLENLKAKLDANGMVESDKE